MSAEGETAEPGGWRAGFVLFLAVLAVIHSVVIGLFLLPSGPVRQAADPGLLSSYVDPYFEQSWDRLEPNEQHVDEALEIRVQLDTGKKKPLTTPWFDITKVENRSLRHDVNPARMHDAARRLATNLNQVMFTIGKSGRDQVEADFVDRSPDLVTAVLQAVKIDAKALRTYGVVETMTLRYASLYAQSVYTKPIKAIQIRSGRRTAPARSAGTGARVTDLEFQWFSTGWRRVYRGTEDARKSFAAYTNGSVS